MRSFNLKTILLAGIAVLLLNMFSPVYAATVTWGGGGSDNKWSNPVNWSGNTVPGTADVATFNATSTKVCTIDTAVNVAGLSIAAGYTGTVTQIGSITVGSSNFSQAAGTFTGGSADITIQHR